MGNAQSLTRTSGALDSFVSDLGADVLYERRYASEARTLVPETRHSRLLPPSQFEFSQVPEDGSMSAPEWTTGCQDIYQARPWC